MRYIYDVMGRQFVIDVPFEIKMKPESVPFLRTTEDEPKEDAFQIYFSPVEEIRIDETDGEWYGNDFYAEYKEGRKVYYTTYRGRMPFACVETKFQKPDEMIIWYRPEMTHEMEYSYNIVNLMSNESLLKDHHGFMLHSSFIKWEGRGILFSAPSGTGKSTQADLWVKYENADILNGDKAGVRKQGDAWRAYGLPNAGSSEIYRNEWANLSMVVVLRQAKENKIRKMKPMEALSCLYQECVMHRWDKEFTETILDTLTEFVNEVPVYLLNCLPNQGAVELVKETILKEERRELK